MMEDRKDAFTPGVTTQKAPRWTVVQTLQLIIGKNRRAMQKLKDGVMEAHRQKPTQRVVCVSLHWPDGTQTHIQIRNGRSAKYDLLMAQKDAYDHGFRAGFDEAKAQATDGGH